MTHTPTQMTTTTASPPVVERPTPTTTQIGRSVPRIESRAKVSGRAEYIHNFQVPGMLHGKILRSTIPHGRILGAHIVGPNASELIAEATLAIRLEASVDDVIATIHAHPTLAETFREASLVSAGLAIHTAGR